MRKFMIFLAILGIIGLFVVVLPLLQPDLMVTNGSDGMGFFSALVEFFAAICTFAARLGDFVLQTTNDLYNFLPEELHCIFGFIFLIQGVLCVIGIKALRMGGNFLNRLEQGNPPGINPAGR